MRVFVATCCFRLSNSSSTDHCLTKIVFPHILNDPFYSVATPKSSTSTPIAKASHTSPVEKALHTSSSPSKSLPAKVSRDSVADKASKLPGKHGGIVMAISGF